MLKQKSIELLTIWTQTNDSNGDNFMTPKTRHELALPIHKS